MKKQVEDMADMNNTVGPLPGSSDPPGDYPGLRVAVVVPLLCNQSRTTAGKHCASILWKPSTSYVDLWRHRIGEIAKLFVDTGVITLSSFVSPYRADRDIVRDLHVEAGMDFIEVFVDVPLDVAESRDPKGLYKKARAGEIKNFTGIDDPYEAPNHAELVLNSHEMSLEQEVEILLSLLSERGII